MRVILPTFFCAAFRVSLVLLFCWSIHAKAEIVLAKDGFSQAVVVLNADASIREKHAASELSSILKQITGARFEITGEPSPAGANVCVGIGAAKAVDPDFSTSGLGADGIIVRTRGKNIILAGGEPRGTLYAVYSFLEDEVGCRWWTPTVSRIPKKPDLAIGNLDKRYVPPFEHRDILIMPITRDADWSVRNKCVGEMHGYGQFNIMPERGGCRKAWPCGHSYYTILPPDKYFKKHPEWYSLHSGKRTASPKIHSSLCLSNEEMQLQFAENLKAEIRGAHALFSAGGAQYVRYMEVEANPLMLVSVSPEDDSGYPFLCQCEPCVAVDETEGSAAGGALRLANRMADAIASEFPDKTVYMYAYHQTQKPPRITKAHSNVIIWYGPINASFSRPLTDERNRRWHDDLLAWTEICDRVYVYDYPDNVTYQFTPHPNLRALAANIKYFAEIGVTGYHGDGIARGAGGTEMAELRAWLVAKLLWDPTRKPNELISEFADGYYGPAGKHIVSYLDVIHDAVEISGDWLTLSSPPDSPFLSLETVMEAWPHLINAEATVAEDPDRLVRVRIAQLPMMFVFLARWDELKYTASCRGIAWPLPEDRNHFYQKFLSVVESNGITLDPNTLTYLSELTTPRQSGD
jgi:hypothetical protein